MSTLACQALNGHGRRCGSKHRVVATNYHGDDVLYDDDGPEPTWVRVYLCDKHRKARRSSGTGKRKGGSRG